MKNKATEQLYQYFKDRIPDTTEIVNKSYSDHELCWSLNTMYGHKNTQSMLRISSNGIEIKSFMLNKQDIAEILKAIEETDMDNDPIDVLTLNNVGLDDQNIKNLTDVLLKLHYKTGIKLKYLDLSYNNLKDDFIKDIAEIVILSDELQYLSLYINRLHGQYKNKDNLKFFKKAIQGNCNLKEIKSLMHKLKLPSYCIYGSEDFVKTIEPSLDNTNLKNASCSKLKEFQFWVATNYIDNLREYYIRGSKICTHSNNNLQNFLEKKANKFFDKIVSTIFEHINSKYFELIGVCRIEDSKDMIYMHRVDDPRRYNHGETITLDSFVCKHIWSFIKSPKCLLERKKFRMLEKMYPNKIKEDTNILQCKVEDNVTELKSDFANFEVNDQNASDLNHPEGFNYEINNEVALHGLTNLAPS